MSEPEKIPSAAYVVNQSIRELWVNDRAAAVTGVLLWPIMWIVSAYARHRYIKEINNDN